MESEGEEPNDWRARKREVGQTHRSVEVVERNLLLLHHIDEPLLWESYERLKRCAAPGEDGVSWSDYQEDLLESLTDLHQAVFFS